MFEKVTLADAFAADKHAGQVRKYSGEPYIEHPRAVKAIVESVQHTEDMLCAALLHDVVEDTDTTIGEIALTFGHEVALLVQDLTDVSKPEDGNRKTRKEIDRMHTAAASPDAKTIKLADLINNTSDIVDNDPNFAKVYMKEKRLLLDVLKDGDPILWERANAQIERYYETQQSAS